MSLGQIHERFELNRSTRQPIEIDADHRIDLTGFDVERLHILISRHAKLTGSARAAAILADWKTWLPKFRKVMPVEFRRALNDMKSREPAEPKIAIGA